MTCWLCGLVSNPPAPTCKNGPCQICVEVATVDEEINQAVAALRRLLTKRCDLRSEQNRAHDIMHRLPLELKSRIFELVLPNRDEWGKIVRSSCNRSRGKMAPYLTSICRSWRDIAWSIPLLWSTLPILLGTRSTSDPSWVNIMGDWIIRSRTSHLILYIVVEKASQDALENDLKEQLKDVLGVLSQCPNEWQSPSLEIPLSISHVFRHHSDSDFQSHLLAVRRLRIKSTSDWEVPFPKMNPEKIEIYGLSFPSLQISWSHLTSANLQFWDLEGVTQLFRHASQMTDCHIFQPQRSRNFTVPPIIHQSLQTLSLRCNGYQEKGVVSMLLDSLTLPCLRATETNLVFASSIPALVHRSSCPLTRITFFGDGRAAVLPDMRPSPGVADLVLGMVYDKAVLKKLLLGGYFPDLRQLTLPLHSFIVLWKDGIIPMLLDPKRPRPDALNELTLRKFFVRDHRAVDKSNPMWDSEFGKQLKAFQSSIGWWEGGFDFLIPSDEDR